MCCLQTGDPGKREVEFSPSLRARELGDQAYWTESAILRTRRAREYGYLRSIADPPLLHIFALCVPPIELADAFPHKGGTSALFG